MSDEKETLLVAPEVSNELNTLPPIATSARSPQLISDAAWSLVSNLGTVIGGLATLKIITSLVNVPQYGEATLVLGIVGLINFFTINPLFTAHLRIYFDHLKTGLGHAYLRQLRVLLLLAGMLSVLIYTSLATCFALNGYRLYLSLLFPVTLLILLQPLLTATTSLLEAHRKFERLALANIVNKVGQVPILALLLFAQIAGSKAIILAQALVVVPILFLLFSELRSQKEGVRSSPAHVLSTPQFLRGALAQIGWPLLFANIVGWIFTTSDRYLLEHFRGIAEVGIYAANYGLWSIPYQILNSWIETFVRPRLYAAAADHDTERMKQILKWRTAIGLTLGVSGTLLLLLVGQPLAMVLLGRKYWFGRQLMLGIAGAHVLYVVGSGVVSLLIAEKRVGELMKVNIASAASNILLNLVLLPKYGVLGAGWSTLISYLIWVSLLALVQRQHRTRLA
jgi:O-antigen/teichoic acid export membrane protein